MNDNVAIPIAIGVSALLFGLGLAYVATRPMTTETLAKKMTTRRTK
jgi:hypothetical protein